MPNASIFTRRAEPIEVGNRRQLFFDDFCVQERRGLVRALHPPEKLGPVMVPDCGSGQVALQSRNAPQWNPEKGVWEWWYWGSWECEPYGPHEATAAHAREDRFRNRRRVTRGSCLFISRFLHV